MMKSVDLSNEFLAVGCNRGQIFVWCLKTKELVCHHNKTSIFNQVKIEMLKMAAPQTLRRSGVVSQ